MGLGGDLLWTPVLHWLADKQGKPIKLLARPKLRAPCVLKGKCIRCHLCMTSVSLANVKTAVIKLIET